MTLGGHPAVRPLDLPPVPIFQRRKLTLQEAAERPGFELRSVVPKCTLFTYTILSLVVTRMGPPGGQFGGQLSPLGAVPIWRAV